VGESKYNTNFSNHSTDNRTALGRGLGNKLLANNTVEYTDTQKFTHGSQHFTVLYCPFVNINITCQYSCIGNPK